MHRWLAAAAAKSGLEREKGVWKHSRQKEGKRNEIMEGGGSREEEEERGRAPPLPARSYAEWPFDCKMNSHSWRSLSRYNAIIF